MPELREHCPAPAVARPDAPAPLDPPGPPRNPWKARRGWIAARLRSLAGPLARRPSDGSAVDRFAGLVALARDPEEVRVELVRLAAEITGAARVELFGDRNGRNPRRLACWPAFLPAEMTREPHSSPRGPIAGPVARAIRERPGPLTLQLPLRAGDAPIGTLRLTAKGRRPWSGRVIRTLGTLCAIASAAERGLARPAESGPDARQDPQGSTALDAFLAFAHAQARRRHEPLSLLEAAVDRLDSIRELLGEELAEAAIERVSRAIRATVRASDVVARLEDGRLAVLLPNASPENALKVAEAVRAAIARAGASSTTMPTLTASIGVATYPNQAHDVTTLRAAASATLTRARSQGHDRIAAAPPIPTLAAPGLAQRVG